MKNFTCEHCGTLLISSPKGYTTACQHYRFDLEKPTYSKYGNKKIIIDDILFDSIAEGRRYEELKLLMQDKSEWGISSLKVHPVFEIFPGYIKNGKRVRPIFYEADFDITHNNGIRKIIDVKGVKTKEWRMKQKMFEYQYPNLELVIEKP